MTRTGYCACGCGKKTRIADVTRPERGDLKGQPVLYRRGHQARRSLAELFWDRVEPCGDECWVWQGSIATGRMAYGRLKFQGRDRFAHRVSWELANGPIPDGLKVCHTCDNPPCVNPAHLFVGTQKDNLDDRDAKGRAVYHRGARNGSAKLTEGDVVAIRARAQAGVTQRRIAQEFGVTQSAVALIVARKTWAHVEGGS